MYFLKYAKVEVTVSGIIPITSVLPMKETDD